MWNSPFKNIDILLYMSTTTIQCTGILRKIEEYVMGGSNHGVKGVALKTAWWYCSLTGSKATEQCRLHTGL